jgi:hypothetical protein
MIGVSVLGSGWLLIAGHLPSLQAFIPCDCPGAPVAHYSSRPYFSSCQDGRLPASRPEISGAIPGPVPAPSSKRARYSTATSR